MQEACLLYSDRITASVLLKNNNMLHGKKITFFCIIRDALPCTAAVVLYTLVIYIAVWLQFAVLNLVFQYYCSGVNVERVHGPTVSLRAVEPREFDIVTPAAQHNVLLCVILKYGI